MAIIISTLKDNVIWVNNGPFEQSIHREQVDRMVKGLEAKDPEWFYDSFFILSPGSSYVQQTVPSVERKGFNRLIVVVYGEEHGRLVFKPNPDKNEYLFQSYLGSNTPPHPQREHIFPFPLLTPSVETEGPVKPMKDRKYSVFFSGNLNGNRWELYLGLSKKIGLYDRLLYRMRKMKGIYKLMQRQYTPSHLMSIPDAYIRFNKGFFFAGLPLAEYLQVTADSKIILSPRGFSTPECYRTCEAMRYGCLVITERLPEVPYYKDIPAIEVDNWLKSGEIINYYLSRPDLLEEYSAKALAYYKQHLSLDAMIDYIHQNTAG